MGLQKSWTHLSMQGTSLAGDLGPDPLTEEASSSLDGSGIALAACPSLLHRHCACGSTQRPTETWHGCHFCLQQWHHGGQVCGGCTTRLCLVGFSVNNVSVKDINLGFVQMNVKEDDKNEIGRSEGRRPGSFVAPVSSQEVKCLGGQRW